MKSRRGREREKENEARKDGKIRAKSKLKQTAVSAAVAALQRQMKTKETQLIKLVASAWGDRACKAAAAATQQRQSFNLIYPKCASTGRADSFSVLLQEERKGKGGRLARLPDHFSSFFAATTVHCAQCGDVSLLHTVVLNWHPFAPGHMICEIEPLLQQQQLFVNWSH